MYYVWFIYEFGKLLNTWRKYVYLFLDMDKQKSFLDQVTAKMQEVMSRHRSHIQTAGFIPTDGFPEQEELRDDITRNCVESYIFSFFLAMIRIRMFPYHFAGSGSSSGNVDPDPGSKKKSW